MRFLKPISLLLVSILFLASCGYRPSAYYAKQELGKDLFVRLDVKPSDPKNSVLVKDAVTKILIQRVGSNMVNSESQADIIMDLRIASVRNILINLHQKQRVLQLMVSMILLLILEVV